MKKTISLILLLMLAVTLAACGKKNDKKDEPIIIGFNTNVLTNETMTFMVDVFNEYAKENNIQMMVAQDGGDTAVLQNNLENFVAGGCQGIIFMDYDPTGVEPILRDLKEKGIALISYDEYSEVCDYSFLCSNYDLGYAIGKMAADWANEHVTGDDVIWMGLLSSERTEFMKNRSNGIEDGFKENCRNGDVFRQPMQGPGTELDSFNNMMSAVPQIHIFASTADAVVVGIAEAWYGDLVGEGKDISQYGVFSTDATDIALNLINNAKKGKGVYRGTIDLGLKDRVPLGMIKCCHGVIAGFDPGYEKRTYYEVKLVTEENIDEYSRFLN